MQLYRGSGDNGRSANRGRAPHATEEGLHVQLLHSNRSRRPRPQHQGLRPESMTGEVERASFGYDPASVAEWALSFESPKAVYESGVTGFHLCRALRALGLDCAVGAVSKMQRPAAVLMCNKKWSEWASEFELCAH